MCYSTSSNCSAASSTECLLSETFLHVNGEPGNHDSLTSLERELKSPIQQQQSDNSAAIAHGAMMVERSWSRSQRFRKESPASTPLCEHLVIVPRLDGEGRAELDSGITFPE